jgi:hypothetical protein
MMKLKPLLRTGVAVVIGAAATAFSADGDLPKRPDFARYEPMMNHSPFAVATAVAAPPVVSNFAKDLYVANAAHSPNGDLVTLASSTDKNLKLYLTTSQPIDGYSISNIEWSERVGATKVTIMKDGQFATVGFNQALLSAPIASNAVPGPVPMPGQPVTPPVTSTQPAAGFGSTNVIKPAPIPTLPTPPPRTRTVIQRNPGASPAPTPASENAAE